VPIDVRVVAATNHDLQAAVEAGSFRHDLFYRLNVFPIRMPSLRERAQDIPLLVAYLAQRYAGKMGKKINGIDKKTLELFQSYHWPGNVRELQNVIERAVILCEGGTLAMDESWLMRASRTPATNGVALASLTDREKEMIENALSQSQGRVSGPLGAAARLGIPRSTLESRIKSLNINKYRFRSL
jgi:formate hydrogenlyase transcriptional activator